MKKYSIFWLPLPDRLGTLLLELLICLLPVHRSFAGVCSTPTFAAVRRFEVGGSAASVAVGDFNGDGRPDLAVANQGSYDSSNPSTTNSGVSISLSKGDGTFQAAVNYGAGKNPFFVAVGDFNGDGKPDLAVATNPGFSILLGKGDGTFNDAVNYAQSASTRSLAVGDFNGDGKSDLVLAHGDAISILMANADGTLRATVNYNVASQSVIVRDFNGDGIADVAVGNGVSISVLLGKGDGTFQVPVDYEPGLRADALAVGDLNGDGKPDLVAGGMFFDDNGSNVGTVSVLLGKGDGTFQPAVKHPIGEYPISVVVADFDGDGRPDLAVGNGGFAGLLSVLFGNGDGTFQPVSLTFRALALAAGDFNGDGKPDLASTDYSTSISVSLNAGGSASPAVVFAQIGRFQAYGYGGSGAVGDFNGDGTPDLVVGDGDSGNVSVLLGNRDGTLQAAVRYRAGSRSRQVAVGDFNGDGKLDLATANWEAGNTSVLLGKGDGTFQTAVNYGTGTNPEFVAVGDFNGDGKSDLAVANYGGNVSVLLSKGDGTFNAAVDYRAGLSPIAVAVGDFNGDGKADLAVADANAADAKNRGFAVLLGKGNGTFRPAVSYDMGFRAQPFSVAVGDINGDGKLDILLGNNALDSYDQKSGSFTNSNVLVFTANGDGTFQAAASVQVLDTPASIAVGDLNGDGKLDVIAAGHGASYRGGGISLLMGNGDGTFQSAVNYAGASFSTAALADFDGDGKLDFVTVYSDDPLALPPLYG